MTGLTPELLLRAYAAGIFPMAESADDPEVFWVEPELRGIIPLDRFHVPHKLRRVVRSGSFEVRCDTQFSAVMRGCAAATPGRPSTWINEEIVSVYTALHDAGFAHSVETWADGRLVGGLYGLSLNGAFFGESMFTTVTDASKVALVHLVARLIVSGYRLLDTQFITDHLQRFGAIEIPRDDYKTRLSQAMTAPVTFQPGFLADVLAVIQSTTQIS